jgi:3-isopropylmalate dehydrogenase
MSTYRIAALPGDGIGPEVMAAALWVLDRLKERQGEPDLIITSYPVGADNFRRTGVALSPDILRECLNADAVLLAAVGLPDVRESDGTEIQPRLMVGLRRALKLHSAVRPIKLYAGVESPLRDVSAGIDLVIVRENLEGLFASYGGGSVVGDEVVTDTLVVTRQGTESVVDFAFQLAKRRRGRPIDARRRVTCVDKANVFRSLAFFRRIFQDVAARYPEIESDAVYVDAMSLYLVQRPADFDVLVMENQFGDILSDLGAGTVGGLGMAPSAELGDEHGLFQPSHGTAPSIAGQGIANPLAMILSVAMMLDWLGERHHDSACLSAGRMIEQAVAETLATGKAFTPDLGGTASTMDVARAIADALS